MSTTLVVTGASNQIGHFLLSRLADGTGDFVALSRRRPWGAQKALRHWRATDLVAGWPPDLSATELIHAAPLSLLPPLIRAGAQTGLQRLVALSSHSAAVKADSDAGAERSQAQALRRAEDDTIAACEQAGVGWTLFRPTLIYGAGLDTNLTTLAGLIRCFGFVPLPGPAAGLRQPVHADDLAQACLQALQSPVAAGRRYDLGGATVLSYREMVKAVFKALELQARIVTMPAGLCRIALGALRWLPRYRQLAPGLIDRLETDQVVDNSGAARDFDYAPRVFELRQGHFERPN